MVVVFAFAAMGLLAAFALNFSFMNPVAQTMRDFSLTDIYYYVLRDNDRTDTSRMITIVDMTDLPGRTEIACVLEEIEAMNPKTVGVDIVFEGEKSDSMGNRWLMNLARTHSNIIFSYRMDDYRNDTIGYANDHHSFFIDSIPNVKEGFTNFERSLYGGVKRVVSLNSVCRGEQRTSFVYEVSQHYADGAMPKHEGNSVKVNFRPTIFRTISPDSVAYHRDWIEGQIVLFGAVNELSDTHYTPLGEMAGVELLAYSVQTLLQESEVKQFSPWVVGILSFFLVLLTYLGRTAYIEWARKIKNEWLRFFLTTTFIVGLLLFLWTGFLAYCAFLLFIYTGYSFSLGWTMAAIPFLGGAGEFYGLTIRRCFGRFSFF